MKTLTLIIACALAFTASVRCDEEFVNELHKQGMSWHDARELDSKLIGWENNQPVDWEKSDKAYHAQLQKAVLDAAEAFRKEPTRKNAALLMKAAFDVVNDDLTDAK